MEQYKVILVDDEVEVIDVMKKKIRWNDLGFDVVGSATNGVKALELVEKLQPDVVLTDIKMPYMDGLELARKLNQDYPNIYIMLCTGFDEFEYAKEAVHLEIKEYMLKPISATELSESLMKLKATLDREREEKLNVKKLEDYFQEVLPKLQSNFFISLIEGRVREEDYERFLLDYQVEQPGDGSCLARIRIDVGNADYDKAIDSVIPHVFQEKDAHTVLGEDYAGSGNLQEVMQFMHNAPTAAKKEFYIVKTLSVEKETIARNFENSAASQGAVLRIGSLRFFLKQS